jgi:gliding motility-associated lipoprotein GldH
MPRKRKIQRNLTIGRKTEGLMTKRTSRLLFSCLLAALLYQLTSCNSNVVFTDFKVMDNSTWDLLDPASFAVQVDDTLHSNKVFFTIRTGSDYPFRNIWLFVTTASPEGKVIGDTLQYYLIDDKGKRFGKGFGDIREVSLPYKSNVYFPLKGTYRFTVQHGMRTGELKGIYDVGLRVETISN